MVATFLCCAALCGQARESRELKLDDLKRAVVIVTTFDQSGQPLLQGSGFFVTSDTIVTNLHVITSATAIHIKTFSGTTLIVQTVLACDAVSDLALLQVTGRAAAVLAVDAARPTEGEPIILLSNPRGSTWRVARGVVGRTWEFASTGSRLQITTDVFPGSSGGPVINRHGRVVGIAVMRMESGDNLNFAVPAASLRRLHTSGFTAVNSGAHSR
jgi:S1-C subfamily serine protease